MASNTKEFNITGNAVQVLENTAQATINAKKELKELQKQMLSMDTNSEEFQRAAVRAGELKDQMNDAADAVRANTGPAIEGLRTSFALMGDQMRNLDFGGLSQSISLFGSNLKKLKPDDITNGFKDMLNAAKNAIVGLWRLVSQNPLLGMAGALVGIVAYWKEINGLINSSDISKLEKQKQILNDEARILETQLATEKAKGISIEKQYNQEVAILKKKIDIATQEEKLARLKGDTDAITEAVKNKEQAIYDLKILQAQLEGKINAGVEEAKRNTDKAYGLQQKKNEAAKTELDAIESIKTLSRQDAETIKNKMLDINAMNAMLSKQKFTQEEIIDAKNQGLITERDVTTWIDNAYKSREAIEGKIKKGLQDRINVGNSEVEQLKQIMFGRTSELGLLVKSAKAKMDAVKSEEELAKIEEEKRKKAEQDEEAKRKREERLRKIEEDKKKLAEDVAAIEKDIAEFKRRSMSEVENEIFQAEEKYKIQRETYIRAKKSKSELEELEALHNIHIMEILQKGDAEQAKIDEEANALKLKQQEELQQKQKELEEKHQEDQKQRAKELNDFIIEGEAQLAESKWAIANTSVELLSTLFQKNKKAADVAFALEKALAIGKIVVSTRAANAEVLAKQLAFFASSGPAALPLAAASSAPMIAANNINAAASIASIVASGVSRFMNGGSVGSSGSLPSSPSGTTAPTQTIGGFLPNQPTNQPPIQAYVIGGQVATSIEAQQLIQNQSRLGG